MDINQNIAECVKHANHFGSDVYFNICNSTSQVVPWGGVDWILNLFVVGIVVAISVAVVGFLAAAAYEIVTS